MLEMTLKEIRDKKIRKRLPKVNEELFKDVKTLATKNGIPFYAFVTQILNSYCYRGSNLALLKEDTTVESVIKQREEADKASKKWWANYEKEYGNSKIKSYLVYLPLSLNEKLLEAMDRDSVPLPEDFIVMCLKEKLNS